ncbi:MAG: RluA family pseudouridine synthase [Ardenticatenia bacterium]|nr:RluA family pseudouridine synthase [Ardenticatenia bacterium]
MVHGHPDSTRGLIGAPIGRDPRHRQRLWVVPDGRPATTEFEVMDSFPGYTLLLVRPITGRTHQIRVHLAAIGHPVAGDSVYGPRQRSQEVPLRRHFLHAWRLTLMLLDGSQRTFEAPLPPDLQEALDALRQRR